MVSVEGLAVTPKSGEAEVEKTAVCTVSGSGFSDPFVIITQVLVPETLLGLQADEEPDWNPNVVPDEASVTL